MRAPSNRQPVATRASRTAMMLLIVLLFACTKHDTQYITPWLRVDVERPRTGDSGVISLGSKDEVFDMKRDGRWSRVGIGHSSSYMLMAEETAVLLDLHDGKGLQLVRGDEPPRSVPFDHAGDVFVPPSGGSIDVLTIESPVEAHIYRYDVASTPVANYRISIPASYSDCRFLKIAGYDAQSLPYGYGDCKFGSLQASCLLVGPNDFLYAVPSGHVSECTTFPRSGTSLREPAHFTVFQ